MPLIYFGTRLSENISRREPEGYLICLNVPVARSGTQDYLPSELGLPEPDCRMIPVYRPEEEVFSPACLASFEGMPVTDDHPASPEGVTAENIRYLQKGHAHHIRRGAGAESDLLLADLIITDPCLISEILSGKREISCGYNYTLCEEEGRFIQRDIRGNHVAVVDAGRAGKRVSIRDARRAAGAGKGRSGACPVDSHHLSFSKALERSKLMKNSKDTNQKKALWSARLMARMARDGDVEGLAEVISEVMEETLVPADPVVAAVMSSVAENLDPVLGGAAGDAETEEAPASPVVVETPVDQPVLIDCGPQILESLREIIALLSAAATVDCDPARATDVDPADAAAAIGEAAQAAAEAVIGATETVNGAAEAVTGAAGTLEEEAGPGADEDPVEILVAEILEGAEGEGEATPEEEILSTILDPADEAGDEDPDSPEASARAADALRAALSIFRPQLMRMSPRERQRFNADVAARMKRLTRRQEADGKPNAYAALRQGGARDQSSRALGQKIMASRNVNLRK